jgi:hypothetical protein
MMGGENPHSWAVVKRIPENSVGVELGVWSGDTSQQFLDSGKVRLLHLVDAWSTESYRDDPDYIKRHKGLVDFRLIKDSTIESFQRYYDEVYADVVERFKDSPVEIHRMTTEEFFVTAAPVVDWVYVDASHEHSGVLADLVASRLIVKLRGSIFGDDYGNKPGVVSAVDEFVKTYNLGLDLFEYNQYEIKL